MTLTQTIDAPATADRSMSYEDFLRISDGVFAEWVNGRMVIMSAVSNDHAMLCAFFDRLLGIYVESRKAGVLLTEPFVMKTGPDLPGRSPDLLFVAQENISRLRQQDLNGPADLVVEVVSPESQTRDRLEKYAEYEKGGVREYWVIDPVRRQAEFYVRGEDGLYHLSPPDREGIFHSTVLPGLWLRVAWLWQVPLPPVLSVLKELRIV